MNQKTCTLKKVTNYIRPGSCVETAGHARLGTVVAERPFCRAVTAYTLASMFCMRFDARERCTSRAVHLEISSNGGAPVYQAFVRFGEESKGIYMSIEELMVETNAIG